MSSKKKIVVMYVSSIGSSTQYVDEKNSNDLDAIFDSAWEDIRKQQIDVGEIWIDDIWVEGIESPGNINWKDILTDKKGLLDKKIIDKVFADDEFGIKAGFIIENAGSGTNINDYIDNVEVYDAKRDNWLIGNYGNNYPETWVEEYADNFFPDLKKQLEKVNGEGYFDWARLISDNQINGEFEADKMDDYFVVMQGHF